MWVNLRALGSAMLTELGFDSSQTESDNYIAT